MMRRCLLLLLVSASGPLLAFQPPQPRLVRDINSRSESIGSIPMDFLRMGDSAFFRAWSPGYGHELWKTDGTAGGTVMLKDIIPGSEGGYPTNLTPVGPSLYFTAKNPTGGTTLWKSDGTPEGTSPAVELLSGGFFAVLKNFVGSQDKIFYTVDQGRFSTPSLYASDGTPEGTVLLNPMDWEVSPFFRPFHHPGKGLPYSPDSIVFPASGNQLWVSDGTVAGTEMIAQVPMGNGAGLDLLAWAGDLLFMRARTDEGEQELWTFDPATGQVGKVFASGTGGAFPWIEGGVAVGDRLFFNAMDEGGGELWVSDGSGGGTYRVKDIRPGPAASHPAEFVVVGDTAFFTANDGSGSTSLWRSDGTEQGTRKVTGGGKRRPLGPRLLAPSGNGVSFVTDDSESGSFLWRSDGTAKGTVRLKKIAGPGEDYSVKQLVPMGSGLLFTGNDGQHGTELWSSNGTPRGTKMLIDICSGTKDGYTPWDEVPMAAIGGRLCFRANDGVRGEELWVTDGTAEGTHLVRDLIPGKVGGEPRQLTETGGSVFFVTHDPKARDVLWKTDGSREGTRKVIDLRDDAMSSYIRYLTPFAGQLFFSAQQADAEELWVTDGTQGGTGKLQAGGVPLEWPGFLTVLGGDLYFSARQAGNGEGEELWRSDGTSADTAMVKALRPGELGSSPSFLTTAGNRMFFRAFTDFSGIQLWKTDGSSEGTVKVNSPGLWSGDSDLYPMIPAGENLYFLADDGTHGSELWKSDGTAESTFMVKDIHPTGEQPWEFGSEHRFRVVGDILYFIADDGVHGEELWRTDGTSEGTALVTDIFPGSGHSSPADLIAVGDRLYFSADDGSNGREWWTSDGSAEGTLMVADLSPGSGGSDPRAPFLHQGKLYFCATTPACGSELWVMDGLE